MTSTPRQPTSYSRLAQGFIPWLLLCGCALGLWRAQDVAATPSPQPALHASQNALELERRCAECHVDVTDQFATAPHAQTLLRVSEANLMSSLANREFVHPKTGVPYKLESAGEELHIASPAYGREAAVAWCFGSGHHARTPLITWRDPDGALASIEPLVTWFPDNTLDVTPGMEKLEETYSVFAMGVLHPPQETTGCFGCHVTHLPLEEGRISFDGIQPGVRCARCHTDLERHVSDMDAGRDTTIERFSQLSPHESVFRCGECHRRASEMGAKPSPQDTSLIRFASVGLVESSCFLNQGDVQLSNGETARLDCTTCHSPHSATDTDWRTHVAACIKCHDENHTDLVHCPQAGNEANCLPCHMPKVPQNSHLSFTDHWIRIRDHLPSPEGDAPER
ncbi:MAG: multiheme c-type cytochrome [Planctomycetaceae bacterium]